MLRLDNKVALITGGARGIGKAIAMTMAAQGASPVLCDIQEPLLQEAREDIKSKTGQDSLTFVCDVANAKQVEETVKKTLDSKSRIDILVNNAGITRDQLLATMSENDWDSVLSINLKSVFLFTKSVSRIMMKQRYGRIVNMASIIGVMGNAGQANYAASKGGVIAITKSTARELGKRGVTANAIAPGFIQTAMTDKLKEEHRQALLSQIPLARLGSPQDVANTALFLASDEAGYINGQVIQVCGGMLT
ncbi:MAG: 3-oxoacyl-[acyl-carrier-protein] reductase [Candidatus Omnitrophica bacterium CG11_big_fil_rev_8_21_14_0_20_45_26]|uniref:3-oxoacyl-[acyl-carrier-protein] reductase n=1 Tax=Candidatus Abzuiibacterium crystallinum TaxID=1974748 RepID=A0A2H0LS85_9BACT|nr:MAG: 3-oxoacyl-[acyl-carrier-protein] reductase [Candidatus Omnitrophica bacterium CG11_big_fil_rev_8_21_14_0_20_45_26]PIW65038.1 MAG: 3-oxoacyl-[acyl-carrier-protein] reductase [Candidatus Omnitrophica bacterium CG12_big_fil_rev_8_21_14_0_65_45_16]